MDYSKSYGDVTIDDSIIDLTKLYKKCHIDNAIAKYNKITYKNMDYCQYIVGKKLTYFTIKFNSHPIRKYTKPLPIILADLNDKGLEYIIAYEYINRVILPVFLKRNPKLYNEIRRYGDIVKFFRGLAKNINFMLSQEFLNESYHYRVPSNAIVKANAVIKNFYNKRYSVTVPNYQLMLHNIRRNINAQNKKIDIIYINKECKIKVCYNIYTHEDRVQLINELTPLFNDLNIVYISEYITSNVTIDNIIGYLKESNYTYSIKLDISDSFNSVKYSYYCTHISFPIFCKYGIADENLCVNIPISFYLFSSHIITLLRECIYSNCCAITYVDDILICGKTIQDCRDTFRRLNKLLETTPMTINLLKIEEYQTVEEIEFVGQKFSTYIH